MFAPRLAACVVVATLLTTAVRCEELPAHALVRLGTAGVKSGDEYAAVAVSGDGKYLAAGGYSGPLRVWDFATGKAVETPAALNLRPISLAFLSDNKTLLVCAGNQFYAWDVTGTDARVAGALRSGYARVAVSPDGKILAATSDQHDLQFTDLAKKTSEYVAGHKAYLSAVAFSPDGKTLASGSNDRTLRLWDVATKKERHVCTGHDDQVSAVAFSPDGKTVVSASWDGTLRLWDADNGKERHQLKGHRYEIHAIFFAPDGKSLASGSADGTVRIWDAATGKELNRWTVHESGVVALAYTKDGKVVTVDALHNVQLWDTTGKEVRRFGDKEEVKTKDYVYCCAWAPDGKSVALGHLDGRICLHDAVTGKEIRMVGRHPGHVWSVAFSPDGKTLASSARRQGAVRLWDVASGDLIRSFPGHMGGITHVLFTPDGKSLIASGGTFEPVIVVHEVATGKTQHRLEGHTNYVQTVALAPDGKTLVSAAHDGTVRVWDLASGSEKRHWSGWPDSAMNLAFLGDKEVLARDDKGVVRLYDVDTGRARREFMSFDHWSAISPDGRNVAGVNNGADVIYELAAERERRTFTDGAGRSHCMAFSPDGRRLLTGSADGSALIWDVTAGITVKGEPTERERETHWNDLADDDASKAFDAVWKLSLAGKGTVPFLRDRLKTAPPADAKKVARWIVDLDDEDFEVREKATKELANVGDSARSALAKALETTPSAEVRRRVQLLLSHLDGTSAGPSQRRELRALEVLEKIGSAEAHAVIETLSKGPADARLTREAKIILGRMR
jgi:WD40 repeat protein